MAPSSPRATEERESARKSAPWLPLLFFIIFLCASFYCAWLVWNQYAQARSAHEQDQSRLELLQGQKKELEELLKLSPCDAAEKAKLHLPPTTIPAAPQKTSARENAGGESVNGKVEGANSANPDNIEAACVFLVGLAEGNKLSTGSGFFVAPGLIATNRHVLGSNPDRVLVTSKALGQPVTGTMVAKSGLKGEDFALVRVDVPHGAHIAPLSLATGVKKTQRVGAWGFPNIIGKNDPAYASLLKGENINAVPELSYSEGVVSAVLDRKPRLIAHTAPISPGNSGGPLLDENGRVVGINTMITLDEDSYRQASLALSADDLANFIKASGIPLP